VSKQQADAANSQATAAQASADKATAKAELYASVLEPTTAHQIQADNPQIF